MKTIIKLIKNKFEDLRWAGHLLRFHFRRLTGAIRQQEQQQLTEIWPAVSGTTPGYVAKGKTTIMWGTNGILSSPFPSSGGGFYTVIRASEKPIFDRSKIPNGNGVTTSDVFITDGATWELTVRDDSTMTPPTLNTTASVVDIQGLLGTQGLVYTARVVDTNYEAALKEPGTRTLMLDNLLLIDSQTSSSQTAR